MLAATVGARQRIHVIIEASDCAGDGGPRRGGGSAIMNVIVVRKRNSYWRSNRGPREGKHVRVDTVEHQYPSGPLNCICETVAESVDEGNGRSGCCGHVSPDSI